MYACPDWLNLAGFTISAFCRSRVDANGNWAVIHFSSVNVAYIPELLMLWSLAYLQNGYNMSTEITIAILLMCLAVTKNMMPQWGSDAIHKLNGSLVHIKSIDYMKSTYFILQEMKYFLNYMKSYLWKHMHDVLKKSHSMCVIILL